MYKCCNHCGFDIGRSAFHVFFQRLFDQKKREWYVRAFCNFYVLPTDRTGLHLVHIDCATDYVRERLESKKRK